MTRRRTLAILLAVASTACLPLSGGAASAATVANRPVALRTSYARQSVAGTVTVWGAATAGSVFVYPCAEPRPALAVASYRARTATSSFVLSRSDAYGKLCVATTSPAQLSFTKTLEDSRVPVSPAPQRVVTTVPSGRPLLPGHVATVTGAPATALGGYLRAVTPTGTGTLSMFPCATPTSATALSFTAGTDASDFTFAKTDTTGRVCITTTAPTHVIFDRVSVAATSDVLAPVRRLDTRLTRRPVTPTTPASLDIAGSTAGGTVTVFNPASAGTLSIGPCAGGAGVAPMTFPAGKTTSAFLLGGVDGWGKLCVRSSTPTHVSVDQTFESTTVYVGRNAQPINTAVAAPSVLPSSVLPPQPDPAGEYALVGTQDGTATGAAVRFDPCAGPIVVNINLGLAPESERALLLSALAKVTAATGLPVVLGPDTTFLPQSGTPTAWPSRGIQMVVTAPGKGPGRSTAISPADAGYAYVHASSIPLTFLQVRTSGQAFYNWDYLSHQSPRAREGVYLHELAHVLGLGHTPATAHSILNVTRNRDINQWGTGDLVGLAKVGAANGCVAPRRPTTT